MSVCPPLPVKSTSKSLQRLQSFLNERMRVTISDGRVFIGYFMCIDSARNLILSSSEEFKDGGFVEKVDGGRNTLPDELNLVHQSFSEERRFVGLIMIPGQHLVKAEVAAEDPDLYT
ncbi:hypothetical protein HKX48_009146 [Thoreauomyces humboldtii]|nr:hypothetical protein HKX48_009146 [Thoreauomyces humboldtii]